MKLSKELSRRRWRELRNAVNAWDPVGLIGLGAPADEYECLVDPLMRMLENGSRPDEIVSYLDQHIPDHFGVSIPVGAQEFTNGIVNWFEKWKVTIDTTT